MTRSFPDPIYPQSQLAATSVNLVMAALGEDLLATVNKLQDLVFNTIGNDSLDLPQIVSTARSALLGIYIFLLDDSNRV